MHLRWRLLVLLCLVFTVYSCKKESTSPSPPVSPTNPVTPVTPGTEFSLSNVLRSNMVVQRNKPFVIWGKGSQSLNITINVSWNNTTFYATINSSGNWQVAIPAAVANASPQTIIVKAGNATPITLTNILIGDVWICSGQSNMVFEIDSIPPFRGVTNYPAEIAAANYPQICTLTLQEDLKATPC